MPASYVGSMRSDIHHERVADGKVRIGATLPRPLVARLDLAVAFRHLRDDWISRVTVFEECLVQFLAAGGIASTSTRPPSEPEPRKIFRLNMDYELASAVYAELAVAAQAGERLAPWHVLAIAVTDHLEDVEPQLRLFV